MATVLEVYATEEQRSAVRSLGAKGLGTKDIHKEMFPVYGGKCLSRKAVYNWAANVSLMTKRLRQKSKDFLCCGFRSIGKVMGQMHQC
jgi:hypothetical protein